MIHLLNYNTAKARFMNNLGRCMCCLNMECSEVLLRSPSFLSCLHSTFHPLWVSFSPLKAFTRNNNKEQPTPLLSNPFCPRTFSLSIAIHLSVLCFPESIMLSINIKIVIYSTSVLQPIIRCCKRGTGYVQSN